MARRSYLTVPYDLAEHADAVADHLEEHGFRVRVEHADVAFPYTPTFYCRRGNTTMLVEVMERLDFMRLERWSRFGHSTTSDTRVVVATPGKAKRTAKDDQKLRKLRLGLYLSMSEGVIEVFPAQDLGMNIQLPDIAKLPVRMRELLGPAYEQFDRSQWREGFEEACQAVESEARRYLKRGTGSGRIIVLTEKGNVRNLSTKQIDRMTLGQLKDTFKLIQSQNHADTLIFGVLDKLNRDRVGVAHHKGRARTESSLRKNVGQHMWSVDAALRAMLGIG